MAKKSFMDRLKETQKGLQKNIAEIDRKAERAGGLFFSVPMIFDKEYVKFLARVNRSESPFKVRRAYNSLPMDALGRSLFEHGRSITNSRAKLDTPLDLKPFVDALRNEGIEFVYTMNSVATVSNHDFEVMAPRLSKFLTELSVAGVKYITVGNQMLAAFIQATFPQFTVGASTMMDVYGVLKAQYLIEKFGIKYIVPATDVNKDFNFIDAFVEAFPTTILELMADEACIFSCPTKNIHYGLFGANQLGSGECHGAFAAFPNSVCASITNDSPELQIVKNRIIYPWEINELANRGVSAIKLVGRDTPIKEVSQLQHKIEVYVKGSADPESIMKEPYSVFNSRFRSVPQFKYGSIEIGRLKPYLPTLEYFDKAKQDCRSICGVTCKHCHSLADKLLSDMKDITPNIECRTNEAEDEFFSSSWESARKMQQ